MKMRALAVRKCFVSIFCAGLVTFCAAITSAAPSISPSLFTVSATSTRAVALESVSMRAEPFTLNSEGNFNPADPRTRLTLFCMNLDFLAGEPSSALTVDAEDAAHTIYPLKVEYVGAVPDFPGIYMIVVRLNDLMTANLGDVLLRLNLHGMASNRARVAIGQIGGGPADDSAPNPAPATPPGAPTSQTLAQFQAVAGAPAAVAGSDGVRFLEQATWGATEADLAHLRAVGIQAYLNEQFGLAPENVAKGSNYPDLTFPLDDPAQGCPGNVATCVRDNYSIYPVQKTFVTNGLTRQDQLRQRVAFALHQILVVSGLNPIDRASWMTMYLQVLDRGAYGNYRTLLQEITLNPEMGDYLDMRLSTRTNPNENWAREVLQLFSIGVNELNLDGTPKLDSQGVPIPAYTQTNVNEFTRLFTGWNFAPAIGPGITNWRDPMVPRGGTNHDFGSKALLYGPPTPACPSTSGAANIACAQQDLQLGLDNLFNHPNVGPFIGKQLIQHLVTSNPSPAYVERVATAFNNNRTNPNQMQEVVKAILLDPEARGDVKTDPNYGKLREPLQYILAMLRGFNATSDGVIGSRSQSGDLPSTLDQPLFQPATVFSYYQPGYEVPGTGILGPAFGILSTSTTLRRANVANTLIYTGIPVGANNPTGTQLSFTSLEALASNPSALVDQLNALFLHGTMSAQVKTSIVNALNTIPTSDPNFARKRAQSAAYLTVTSSQFDVQR